MNADTFKSLLRKLERGEKTLLREAGLHPTKNRTRNLINYIDTFTDEESDLLIEILIKEGHTNMHLGMLAFVNRNHALDVMYSVKKYSPLPRYRGYQPSTVILDDIDDSVTTTLKNKNAVWTELRDKMKNYSNAMQKLTKSKVAFRQQFKNFR